MTQQNTNIPKVTPQNEWWLRLVEETLNRPPTDKELQIKFDAIDDEDRGRLIGIVDDDAATTLGGGVGLWLASQILLEVAHNGFRTLTMEQMVVITKCAEHMKELFWTVARHKYPDTEVLGLRSDNGRLVIVNLKATEPEKTAKSKLAKMIESAMVIKI